MVATKKEAMNLVESMTDIEIVQLCNYLNNTFLKESKRQLAEKKFIAEVKEAEESVSNGNFVTSTQLHEFLGV